MYKNIVFGGSGFLGSNLADEISKSKNKILIIDKKPKKVLKNFQKQINCDILNLEKYKIQFLQILMFISFLTSLT